MPFDSGSISFRVCDLKEPMPEDALERFAEKAAGPLEYVKNEPKWGWVSGRHLLETRIDDQTAYAGGYLHLTLRQAERKIPASLLKAECRMAELALLQEQGGDRISRKQKKQIKEDVTERLLPDMPPTLSGMDFVVDEGYKKLYLGATSDKQLDTFMASFYQTVGIQPVPIEPELLATELTDAEPSALPVLNFSDSVPDTVAGGTLGQSFLTWLWFYLEQHGGVLPKNQLGDFSMMIDGPLVFVAEDTGALESSIRKGVPTASAEAKAALSVGKKLKRAKLTMVRGKDQQWQTNIDADNFVFRSMKLPEGEALDPASIFEERVTNIYVFQTMITQLFKRFIEEISNSSRAAEIQKDAQEWVQAMRGK
ncbi:MAG: recombination-associated protein RdgC [Lentisphaeria bacterium]